MLNTKLLKCIAEFASRDYHRPNLCHIYVREMPVETTAPDGSAVPEAPILRIEACDGHRLIRIECSRSAFPLGAGFYTIEDWTDLVCKGRLALPDCSQQFQWPDTDAGIPAKKAQETIDVPAADGEVCKQPIGIQHIGFDPWLLKPLCGLGKGLFVTWQFTDSNRPIRGDFTFDAVDCLVLIMPMRLK